MNEWSRWSCTDVLGRPLNPEVFHVPGGLTTTYGFVPAQKSPRTSPLLTSSKSFMVLIAKYRYARRRPTACSYGLISEELFRLRRFVAKRLTHQHLWLGGSISSVVGGCVESGEKFSKSTVLLFSRCAVVLGEGRSQTSAPVRVGSLAVHGFLTATADEKSGDFHYGD